MKSVQKYNYLTAIKLRAILYTAKLIEKVSIGLAARLAYIIFTTPIRYKTPKREKFMEAESIQEKILIPDINKKINIYKIGNEYKRVLLIHGWSGRGTQLQSIASALAEKGYGIISFDAPAHGKSEGNSTEMNEFISCINQINKIYGPFSIAIGHSLGAMSILNAVNNGITIETVIIIGSGDVISDVVYNFTKNLGMGIAVGHEMIKLLKKKYNRDIDEYSAHIVAQKIEVPVLIIHDMDDKDVHIDAAYNIQKHLKKSELLITNGLGHRRILRDNDVINKIIKYLESK